MSILAYLTGFVLGALLVLLVMGLRERRLRREHAQHARWALMALGLVRNKLIAMRVSEDNTAMENLAAAIKTLASAAGVDVPVPLSDEQIVRVFHDNGVLRIPTRSLDDPDGLKFMVAIGRALIRAAGVTPCERISEDDLAAIEQQLAARSRSAPFFPADANWLADATALLIREVRATRGVPATAIDLRELVLANGRACIEWAQAGPEDVQQKFDAMQEARENLFRALGVAGTFNDQGEKR